MTELENKYRKKIRSWRAYRAALKVLRDPDNSKRKKVERGESLTMRKSDGT